MMSAQNADLSLEYEIGDSVFIENKEWIIAEIQETSIRLQRDGVDGSSRTLSLSHDEIKDIVKESQHMLEN